MRILPGALALAAIAGAGACRRLESAEGGGGATLMRNLLRARAVEIVVRPGGPLEDACWRAAQRIEREHRVACRVVAPVQAGDPRAVRIVVAGPDSELGRAIVGRMGLNPVTEDGRSTFAWRTTRFREADDVLLAVVEDPERRGLPLTLLYANDEDELAPYLAGIEPGWKPSLRIHSRRDARIEAPLSVGGTIDESRLVSRAIVRRTALLGHRNRPGKEAGVVVAAPPRLAAEAIDRYLDAVARARAATRAWADADGPVPEIRLVLHERAESFAAWGGGATLSAWNPATREVHALLAPDVPDDAGSAAAGALAEDLLGPPSAAWLADGAATLAAGRHYGRDLDEWIAWLREGGSIPNVGALVDARATEAISPHLVLPLRAALFRFLLEGRNEDFVRSLWRGQAELRVDPDLQRSFDRWLDDATAPRRPSIEARRESRRGALLGDAFLGAVGIEEPGSDAARGFGSERFRESLAQARELGAGGVALTCYAVAERDPPGLPDLGPGARARRALAPTCGDLRLFAALCQARAAGMRTLLQPRLLTAPGGSFAGTGPQDGEIGWQRFFDGYARILGHFALLAELAGADGLALGGGMTASTSGVTGEWRSTEQELAWRLSGWRRVIGESRAAFSGTITWTADSQIDALEHAFWGELDLVACDLEAEFDVPGTSFHAPPEAQVRVTIDSGLAVLEEIARSNGKPLLLTQAGFRAGAPEPAAEGAGRIAGLDGLQRMQIGALAGAIGEARKRGILRGVVLWRWSTDPSDRGANPADGLLRPGPARDAAKRLLQSKQG